MNLAPSVFHGYLMAHTKQPLAYRGGDVVIWRRRLRAKLRQLIGEMPVKRVPLNVRTLWRRDHPLGTIEKIIYTAEPYADVPAYICLPKAVSPPYAFMVCLQGHTTGMHNSIAVDQRNEGKAISVEGDRDFALGCMSRGIAAVCIEQRSMGERKENLQKQVSPHPCHDAVLHSLMLGRTLLGERIFDVDRAIDYLEARGDVDFRCLGIMGNSGGGLTSIYSAALLPRIRFAIPSGMFCTFQDSIMSIYHCADNYVPSLYQYAELPDVMGLFVPRPVVIVAGKKDEIIPVHGVRKAYRQLKKIYRAAGAESHCHLVVGNEGHRFYAELAWPKALMEIKYLRGK